MNDKINNLIGALQDKQFALMGKARIVFAICDLLATLQLVDTPEFWEQYTYMNRN